MAPDVWVVNAQMGPFLARIPVRMTLVRIGDALWVHSPIPLEAALERALAALPPVRFIVAPNRFHHLFAEQWIEAYPEADAFAAPGLRAKRPTIPFEHELAEGVRYPWGDALEHLIFTALPLFNEVVFFHRASRTLIVTDLVFNYQRTRWDLAGLFVRVAGAHQRFGPSRTTRFLMRDRRRARAQIDRILAWPFERIVLSHGSLVEERARDALRAAFEWL